MLSPPRSRFLPQSLARPDPTLRSTDPNAPWNERRVGWAQRIQARGNEGWVVSGGVRVRGRATSNYDKDLQRLLKEGYAELSGKEGSPRGAPRRWALRYLRLTDKGVALLPQVVTKRVPEPYANRRAAMAEFREVNRGTAGAGGRGTNKELMDHHPKPLPTFPTQV